MKYNNPKCFYQLSCSRNYI